MALTLLIIPVFNCGESTVLLVNEIKKKHPYLPILIINDGSTDNSKFCLSSLDLTIITYSENQGKGAALQSGFNYAIQNGFEFVITMDGDGQHASADLTGFLEADGDICIGKREFKPGVMPLARIFSNSVSSALLSLACKKKIGDAQCGYRKIKLSFMADFIGSLKGFQFETELIIHIAKIKNGKVVNVPVQTIYGKEKSNINHVRDTIEFIRLLRRAF